MLLESSLGCRVAERACPLGFLHVGAWTRDNLLAAINQVLDTVSLATVGPKGNLLGLVRAGMKWSEAWVELTLGKSQPSLASSF